MGRRGHKPDPAGRRQVEALAGYGIPEAEIAGVIGIDAKTLRKHYRHELDHGHTKANAGWRRAFTARPWAMAPSP